MKNFNFKKIEEDNLFLKRREVLYSNANLFIEKNKIASEKLETIITKEILIGSNLRDSICKILQHEDLIGLFVSLKDDNFKYLAQLQYFKKTFKEINVNDETEINIFIDELIQLRFWEIKLFNIIDEAKFKKLVLNLEKNLNNNISEYLNINIAFARENEKTYYQNCKKKYNGNISYNEKFDIIAEINRGSLPYVLNDKLLLIIDLVLFNNEEKYKKLNEIMSLIDDPYVLHGVVSRYINDVYFIVNMLKDKNINLVLFGLTALIDYLRKIEYEYYRCFNDNLYELINNEQYHDIENIKTEKINMQSEINKLVEDFLLNMLDEDHKKEKLEILSCFLRSYLRFTKQDYRGLPFLLNSIGILFGCIVAQIKDLVLFYNDLSIIRNILPYDFKNAFFYGYLANFISDHKERASLVDEIYNGYCSQFVETVFSNIHPVEFGLQYDYQIQYTEGIINIFEAHSKSTNTSCEFIQSVEKQLSEILLSYNDIFKKYKFDNHNYLINIRYVICIILFLYNEKVKNELSIKVAQVVEIILKYDDDRFISNYSIWMLISGLSSYVVSFKELLFSKINGITTLIPALHNMSSSVTDEIYEKGIKYKEFDLKSAFDYEITNYYWDLYSYDERLTLLNYVYDNLSESEKIKYKQIHSFRAEIENPSVKGIFQFIKNAFNIIPIKYIKILLSFWEKNIKLNADKTILNEMNSIFN